MSYEKEFLEKLMAQLEAISIKDLQEAWELTNGETDKI
jgi:hypothetical protein